MTGKLVLGSCTWAIWCAPLWYQKVPDKRRDGCHLHSVHTSITLDRGLHTWFTTPPRLWTWVCKWDDYSQSSCLNQKQQEPEKEGLVRKEEWKASLVLGRTGVFILGLLWQSLSQEMPSLEVRSPMVLEMGIPRSKYTTGLFVPESMKRICFMPHSGCRWFANCRWCPNHPSWRKVIVLTCSQPSALVMLGNCLRPFWPRVPYSRISRVRNAASLGGKQDSNTSQGRTSGFLGMAGKVGLRTSFILLINTPQNHDYNHTYLWNLGSGIRMETAF